MRWPTFGEFHGQRFHCGHAHRLTSIDSKMWYTIACILATFAIRKATDENGEEIEIDDAFTDNSLIRFGPLVLLYWISAQI